MRSLLPWRSILVLLTATVLYLSLTPAPPTDGLGWDKANHAAAMACITLLAFAALRPTRRAVLFAGYYALGVGITIELLQGLCTTTRKAEWGDLAADAVGTGLAMVPLLISQWRKVLLP